MDNMVKRVNSDGQVMSSATNRIETRKKRRNGDSRPLLSLSWKDEMQALSVVTLVAGVRAGQCASSEW